MKNQALRYLRVVFQIVRKDLLAEWRGHQVLPLMLVLALTMVFTFNFALQLSPDLQAGLSAGMLWISLVFAAMLGLNRSVSLEREKRAMDGLRLIPVDLSAIFFGKSLAHFFLTALVALVLLPLFDLFYGQRFLQPALILVTGLALGAYSGLGTLLATLSVQTRSQDVLLPVLLLPLGLPFLIAAVEASYGVMAGETLAAQRVWLLLLLAGNILFSAAGLFLFEMVLED
jgi:heme exporter protein B